jgi:hypothetical protein
MTKRHRRRKWSWSWTHKMAVLQRKDWIIHTHKQSVIPISLVYWFEALENKLLLQNQVLQDLHQLQWNQVAVQSTSISMQPKVLSQIYINSMQPICGFDLHQIWMQPSCRFNLPEFPCKQAYRFASIQIADLRTYIVEIVMCVYATQTYLQTYHVLTYSPTNLLETSWKNMMNS